MNTEVNLENQEGALYVSLARTNKQVRQERGEALVEDLAMAYEREVQDLGVAIKRKRRKQAAMFDFSGDSTTSLVVKDIDALEIKEADLKLELEIRNLEIKLELAEKRLNHLFVKAD